jgi:hypothetical protein
MCGAEPALVYDPTESPQLKSATKTNPFVLSMSKDFSDRGEEMTEHRRNRKTHYVCVR